MKDVEYSESYPYIVQPRIVGTHTKWVVEGDSVGPRIEFDDPDQAQFYADYLHKEHCDLALQEYQFEKDYMKAYGEEE